jgi:hypothetical protein
MSSIVGVAPKNRLKGKERKGKERKGKEREEKGKGRARKGRGDKEGFIRHGEV